MGSILRGKNVEVGKLIAVNKPYAFVVLNDLTQQYCGMCLKEQTPQISAEMMTQEDESYLSTTTALKKCSKCKFARYCNRECQRKAFKYHKAECGIISKGQLPPPDSVRLFARIVQRAIESREEDTDDLCWRTLDDLMSHAVEYRQDTGRLSGIQRLVNVYRVAYNYTPSDTHTADWLLETAMKMEINALGIQNTGDGGKVGVGVYLSFSILDHCCDPMAVIAFQGTVGCLRAVRKPRSPREKVSISYYGYMKPAKMRQEYLQKKYYFLCDCHWCENTELNRVITSFRCSTARCKGLLIHSDSMCSKCHATTEEQISKIDREIEQIDSVILMLKSGFVHIITMAIELYRTTQLHAHHYKRLELGDELRRGLSKTEEFTNFAKVAEEVMNTQNTVAPVACRSALLPYRLGQVLGVVLHQHKRGIECIQVSMDRVRNAHGVDHFMLPVMQQSIDTITKMARQKNTKSTSRQRSGRR